MNKSPLTTIKIVSVIPNKIFCPFVIKQMPANAGAYDVAGLGGLSNDDRNAKTDLPRLVPPTKTKIEN